MAASTSHHSWEILAGRYFAFASFLVMPLVFLLAALSQLWVFGLYWLFLVFVPQGVAELPGGRGSRVYLEQEAWLIAVAIWVVTAIAYTYLTRRLPFRYFVALAYPVIGLVILLFQGGLRVLGFTAHMDLGI